MTKNSGNFTATFVALSSLFCVCLIISNIMEIKTIDLGPLTITGGFLVFPVSYIINDCIVEVYGFAKARLVIWLGFVLNLFAVLMLCIATALPGSDSWNGQEAMETTFACVPRILAASFAAFICGSMVNAYVMSRMKISSNGKNFSIRAIVSTLWGESTDSIIFFPIAFAGTLPWSVIASLIISQALLKTAYEILVLPLTIKVVDKLKNSEGLDTFDNGISYKWWNLRNL